MFDESEERSGHPDVRLPLALKKQVTGNEVIDAVSNFAVSNPDLVYEETTSPANEDYLLVGCSSEDPAKHIILCSGEELQDKQINPEERYTRIGIRSYEWPGEGDAVIVTEEGVKEALTAIKQGIEELLG